MCAHVCFYAPANGRRFAVKIFRAIKGLHRDYIGIMEKKMETTGIIGVL